MEKLFGKRIYLERLSQKHAEDIFKYFTVDIIEYMYPGVNKTLDDVKNFISSMEKSFERGTDRVFAIKNKENDEFIGVVGLHGLEKEMPEPGIWTKLEAHGNHYGREAVSLLINMAKNMGYKKLIYPVDHRNTPSRKIPEYFKGVTDGIITKVNSPDGRVIETIDYIISI